MLITEGFLLLGGIAFLNSHHESMRQILNLTVGEVSPYGASYVNLVMEALLRRYPTEGSSLLLQSGVIETMLESCAANYNQEKGSEPDRVIVMYLSSFARLLLENPHYLDERLRKNATFNHENLVSTPTSSTCHFRLSRLK